MTYAPDVVRKMILSRDGIDRMVRLLSEQGYDVIGPTLRDQAIVYDAITSGGDLPAGWTDEQDGGVYRLKPRGDDALFGYSVGPHSWKRFLHPPTVKLWSARHGDDGFELIQDEVSAQRFAFFGVRSCDLHAIAIQDKVFTGGAHVDPIYRARREGAFVVAVNCGHAGGTCFCVSMNTGPQATIGFDLALTEIMWEGGHSFVVECGSEAGARLMQQIPHDQATDAQIAAANQVVQGTAEKMGRSMDIAGIRELLYRNYENPRWEEVAKRCLTCANCTMVCPTCFCTTVEDVTDLTGEHAERWRRWDSCFTMDFSYIHGGSVRSSTMSRYRQWMTHKLATWIDQFGTSGCVGCGRCITWCPVGIDITEEVNRLKAEG